MCTSGVGQEIGRSAETLVAMSHRIFLDIVVLPALGVSLRAKPFPKVFGPTWQRLKGWKGAARNYEKLI